MPLQWNRELETGIRELDVQQQELFAKFELFSAAIELEHRRVSYLCHKIWRQGLQAPRGSLPAFRSAFFDFVPVVHKFAKGLLYKPN